MNAGEIAKLFEISKPSLSKHLRILQEAGLKTSEKKGQFIHYRLVPDNIINTLGGFIREVSETTKDKKKKILNGASDET